MRNGPVQWVMEAWALVQRDTRPDGKVPRRHLDLDPRKNRHLVDLRGSRMCLGRVWRDTLADLRWSVQGALHGGVGVEPHPTGSVPAAGPEVRVVDREAALSKSRHPGANLDRVPALERLRVTRRRVVDVGEIEPEQHRSSTGIHDLVELSDRSHLDDRARDAERPEHVGLLPRVGGLLLRRAGHLAPRLAQVVWAERTD